MSTQNPIVLVVDDEPDLLLLIELTLTKLGLQVVKADSYRAAKKVINQFARGEQKLDLCLSDMNLGDGSGLDLIADIQLLQLDLPIAILTAYGNSENAVAALKAGAFDYLAKPVSLDQLRSLVKTALKVNHRPASSSPKTVSVNDPWSEYIGQSPALQKLKDTITKLAKNQSPVHINGESGTGKELAAKKLHQLSPRANGPFVAVNCGAIPETLMESEFFGSKKGSFTGADRDRDGFFQAAHGGTLFLDEVADLPLSMQVKLLRVIQERKVRKVGDTQEDPIDVRVLSASHKPLARMVSDGQFRQDLYYRLNVITLLTPPLRDIVEDIPEIAQHILSKISKNTAQLSETALLALKRYAFPGNVRECENILERAYALSDTPERIDVDDLQLHGHHPLLNASQSTPQIPDRTPFGEFSFDGSESFDDYMESIEKHCLQEAMLKSNNDRTQAARLLGISFREMRYRLERLGL